MILSKKIPSSEYKRRVLEAVNNSEFPIDIDNTRRRAGLQNWESTKALLLELALEGTITAQRTASSRWIFSAKTIPLQPV